MRRRRIFALMVIGSASVALVLCCRNAIAEFHPANPSFSSVEVNDLAAHDFGTFRQGATGATFNLSVTNLPASSGTSSATSLLGVDSLGDSMSIVLQSGTVSGLPADSSVTMPLVLNTTHSGNLQV